MILADQLGEMHAPFHIQQPLTLAWKGESNLFVLEVYSQFLHKKSIPILPNTSFCKGTSRHRSVTMHFFVSSLVFPITECTNIITLSYHHQSLAMMCTRCGRHLIGPPTKKTNKPISYEYIYKTRMSGGGVYVLY